MRQLKEYHHFKHELIDENDRLARYERHVADLLLNSDRADSSRESSICWELKHQASMRQFASILAKKRNLPVDVCIVGIIMHDICSIIHGDYRDHAHRGASIAMEILDQLGGFSAEERNQIWRIIYHHSDKHVWTDDPFQELGKDVDVLDCFLYEGAFDYYLCHKPLPIFQGYTQRAKLVWDEMGIPVDPRFRLLDDYSSTWFEELSYPASDTLQSVVAVTLALGALPKELRLFPPPFSVIIEERGQRFCAHRNSWERFRETLLSSKETFPIECAPALREVASSMVDIALASQRDGVLEPIAQWDDTASAILKLNENPLHEGRSVFLFWPLIDIYEELSGDRAIRRLRELGVTDGSQEQSSGGDAR